MRGAGIVLALALCGIGSPALANALGENVPRPAIPKALIGVFATDPAACRNRDSDGRIEVTSREIRFYESTAKPDRLIELPGGAVVMWADVEGEDDGWNELIGLAPTSQGLLRFTANDGHAGQSRIDYVRCPSARR